jgi:arsenate reductase (thioredoxin)
LRSFGSDWFEAHSAGTDAGSAVHPLAIAVMSELGIDISGQQPKPVRPYLGQPVQYVITVCDPVVERCPTFPGVVQRLTWTFPDPGKAEDSHEQRMDVFRTVRDDIAAHIQSFLDEQTA